MIPASPRIERECAIRARPCVTTRACNHHSQMPCIPKARDTLQIVLHLTVVPFLEHLQRHIIVGRRRDASTLVPESQPPGLESEQRVSDGGGKRRSTRHDTGGLEPEQGKAGGLQTTRVSAQCTSSPPPPPPRPPFHPLSPSSQPRQHGCIERNHRRNCPDRYVAQSAWAREAMPPLAGSS